MPGTQLDVRNRGQVSHNKSAVKCVLSFKRLAPYEADRIEITIHMLLVNELSAQGVQSLIKISCLGSKKPRLQ